MLKEVEYKRDEVLQYAKQWAKDRNPRYADFSKLGGDCTNFASQCIFSGCGVMNYKPTFGWYYNSSSDRSPSWTGVQYLSNFLICNKSVGPYAIVTDEKGVQPGDLVQLGNEKGYYHSLVIISIQNGKIYLATHTFDVYMRALDSYVYGQARFLHIVGARKWK